MKLNCRYIVKMASYLTIFVIAWIPATVNRLLEPHRKVFVLYILQGVSNSRDAPAG